MTGELTIRDVRAQMPNYDAYKDRRRRTEIAGLAIHHSATASAIGVASDDAYRIFAYHVAERGWDHGAYHYLIHANGVIEYALDECIEGYHAGFADADDALGLECGQYWNNHYLAICLLGWFEPDRRLPLPDGTERVIPDFFTHPSPQQMSALVMLIRHLQNKYNIPVEQVQGHRELRGCATRCPGKNVDLDALRAML
jgi:N-acetyl-anhydromuramyl-L-alanine amidase AmpD